MPSPTPPGGSSGSDPARAIVPAPGDSGFVAPRLEPYDRKLDRTVLGYMRRFNLGFVLLVLPLLFIAGAGFLTWGYQMLVGIGIAGIRRPTFWGFYITNFVFWIGISHSGTLVSAILRVLNVEWRRPLTRAAEVMTVFALSIGALFPLIHLGRTPRFYWMLPVPNERGLWPNFHSPLLWDMLAIFTYITASVLFLFLPMVPDLAAARDRVGGLRRPIYKVLSFGWRGTQQQWNRLHVVMRVFTIVVIPIAISVHTIVSWDFGMTVQPAWNSTIFGPYFVIGAIYSGVAALITVLILVRKAIHLEDYITLRHFDRMGKILLAVSAAWFYFFFANFLTEWYSGNVVLREIEESMLHGQLAWLWWPMVVFNVAVPLTLLWWRRIRTSMATLLVISLVINVGMWLERYLIVVGSNMRNYLSYDWGTYWPRWPEILITCMTFAMFALLYVVLSKAIPLISLWEVKEGWRTEAWRREGYLEPTGDLPGVGPHGLPVAVDLPRGEGL